jgi:predicted nucleic acid-binding protein
VTLILDTNALLAFLAGDQKLLRAIESEAELAIPTIVLFLFSMSCRWFARPPRVTPEIRSRANINSHWSPVTPIYARSAAWAPLLGRLGAR